MKLYQAFIFLIGFVTAAGRSTSAEATGTAAVSAEEANWWWQSLSQEHREALADLFEPVWFESLEEVDQASYAHVAESLYIFISVGVDSHPHDSYTGFAPLLLRASFHASGTFHAPSNTGGTNGGTIFHNGELQDEGNKCIDIATREMEKLFQGSERVSLADAMVIAGSVALDTMNFPRMDMVRITGGRRDIDSITFRDRLPSADDNPLELFTLSYNLTVPELVALIGGGHNFGAAHGVCTGYVGQWTSDPLSWASPETGRPEFFVDLLAQDWRWYEVCTYKNGTSIFVSIPDPFADGLPAEEEEEQGDKDEEDVCEVGLSEVTFICEEQAMRGCMFDDGAYNPDTFPCDMATIQFRLRSDFFLKVDPLLRPYVAEFAANDDLLAETFGQAYHKMTHAGLYRCGLAGFCGEGSVCREVPDPNTGEYLASECIFDESLRTNELEEPEAFGDDDNGWSLGKTGSIAVLVASGLLFLSNMVLLVTHFSAVKDTA